MKKLILLIFTYVFFCNIQAQTNTFPASGNVGIGTASPFAKEEIWYNSLPSNVMGTNAIGMILKREDAASDAYASEIGLQAYQGKGAILLGGGFGLRFALYNGTSLILPFALTSDGNVGIGTLNPQSKLAVEGTITSQKIIVTQTGWSDFVFDSAYNLKPLLKLDRYITTFKHLPGIPSSDMIAKKGLDLAEMQKKQMQKIEELTLYMIQQNKIINRQQKIIGQLSKRVNLLEGRKKNEKSGFYNNKK